MATYPRSSSTTACRRRKMSRCSTGSHFSDGLVPEGPLGRTRHLQLLAFISTEMQKPFVRLFFSESDEEKAWLAGMLAKRFGWIASRVEGEYLFGERFMACDAFLYVMLRWASMCSIEVPPFFTRSPVASSHGRRHARRLPKKPLNHSGQRYTRPTRNPEFGTSRKPGDACDEEFEIFAMRTGRQRFLFPPNIASNKIEPTGF